MIGPIAQFIFIPFMTTGAGVDLIAPGLELEQIEELRFYL